MIATRKVDVVDDYHGTRVADPYRWLEDEHDPEVVTWVEAQHERTRAWLDAIPERERIQRRLTELWDFPKYSIPQKHGGWYFFQKNVGLQNQAVLYRQTALDAAPVELLDPNRLSEDGTVALTGQSYSHGGGLLAYLTSASGSDWQILKVRDVETTEDLPDLIQWCKFTNPAWTRDESGFFYNRLPEPGSVPPGDENNYTRICWHTVGTEQSEDTLVYERPDIKELILRPETSHDGRYLVITGSLGTDPRTRIAYRDLQGSDEVVRLIEEADARYDFIDNDGEVLYLFTDLDAPRGRIIAVDTRQPEREHWHEVLPQGEDAIESVVAAGDYFVVIAKHHVRHRVLLYNRDGSFAREVELPSVGSVEAFWGEPGENEAFLSFTSFLYPSTPFRCDLSTGGLKPLHEPAIDFDPSGYETNQLFYTSKDGTRVPMFVVHKRGMALDGNNPTLLYAYGGFNISLGPDFRVHRLAWLEMGGIYAVANLRGGDEYGEEWHQAGMLERKQNVFDDFIAAAEHLIAEGYTSTNKLAINGGSNGGLLVGACMTQRPELYGAVVCEVPVIDMLRYHRFTVGHFWVPEYGNAETDPEHFRFMYAYSPLHNVRPGTAYPPTLIMTADHDDRVVPAHARKFAATLQEVQSGDAPVLLRVEMKAGHGLGKPTSKLINERADVYAFLWKTLGVGENA